MTKSWVALRKMTHSEVDTGKGDANKVSDDGPEIRGSVEKHDYWRDH